MSDPDTVRAAALTVADAKERTTWGRPTFRLGESICAALHDDLLILRSEHQTQAAGLEQDRRLRPAPRWGRDGWIAAPLQQVSDHELSDLLTDAHDLACEATR